MNSLNQKLKKKLLATASSMFDHPMSLFISISISLTQRHTHTHSGLCVFDVSRFSQHNAYTPLARSLPSVGTN